MNKKLLSIILVFALAFVAVMPVMATEPETSSDENGKYATVEDATASDSYKDSKPSGTPSYDNKEDGQKATIQYDASKLKIVHNGTDETTRPNDYSWIGVKMKAPTGAKKFEVTEDTSISNTQAIDTNKLTKEISSGYVTEYFHVSLAELKAAVKNHQDYIIYALKYTWDYTSEVNTASTSDPQTTGVPSTTLVVKIKVAGVELSDTIDGKEEVLWNKAEYDKEVKAVADAEKAEAEANRKPTAAKTNKEKDNTPGTGIKNIYAVAGLVAVVTLAGAVVLNKRK